MSRFFLTMRQEMRRLGKRPMLYVLLALITLLTWGLAQGNVTISSGDASVGGTKAWITSEFQVTFYTILMTTLFHLFFVSVISGTSVIEDGENKVGEILHATPLTPGEYIWGKFSGVMATFGIVLLLQTVILLLYFHVIPTPNAAEIRGPLELGNYLRPLLIFTLPYVLFIGGCTFAVGERTRKPILVFVLPVMLIVVSVFFLWNWSPTWLDPAWNRVLMMLDPSGSRWLEETFLDVDRGVEFYNTISIPLDNLLILQRVGLVLLGLGAVAYSHWRFSRSLRAVDGKLTHQQIQQALKATDSADQPMPVTASKPIDTLGRARTAPSFWLGAWQVARSELRELRSQPGLYLFVPLILIQILGNVLTAIGAFGNPLLFTSGQMAASSMNTITLLVCLLLMFYTVESLQRDHSTGLDAILFSTPVRSTSLLFGKAMANSLVGVVILAAALLGCAGGVLFQRLVWDIPVPFELTPFLLLWGLLLIPTFLLWTSFILCVQALSRNRFTTYTVALAAMMFTGYQQSQGNIHWLSNWNLWGTVGWSDMGALQLNATPLLLNRLFYLGVTVLLTVLTVRWFNRRDWDATRIVHRLRPAALRRPLVQLGLVALPAIVLGVILYSGVADGFQSETAQKWGKDYWRKNHATWLDAKLPAISDVVVDLEVMPEDRSFEVEGTYLLHNHREEPLAKIPLTSGPHWRDVTWTLNGQDFEPEDRAGLYVFAPPEPLAPGEELSIGFAFHGRFPDGFTKNGGGFGQFILPAGVVLTSFQPTFVPVLGYQEQLGIDDENQYDSKEFPDDFYLDQLSSGFGSDTPFTTRITVTGPEELTLNSVGTLVDEQVADGKRTVTWVSDHPVKIFNVVAGRWQVREGEGTAIYYHPSHGYNLDEMGEALDASRRYYSEWFYPYPWQRLKLSEFPALASYAQGFATNITFSENIGFLTRSTQQTEVAFMVTAHEAAHQWWGNILTPGQGPGGNILSEGMSHYSTLLLFDQVKGERGRIEFAKRIEERYGEARRADSERPMVKIDGTRPGDTTVTYDKGGWVFWMLHQHLGREQMLAGLREFILTYENGPDYPVLQDLIVTLRPYAADAEAYDAFVQQWFHEVVLPRYELRDAEVEQSGDQRHVRLVIENTGTGSMPVEVAAVRGSRFTEDGSLDPDYRECRASLTLDAGQTSPVELNCGFEPERILVDPDARVLQLEREKAMIEL